MRHAFRYLVTGAPGDGEVVELSRADSRHLSRVVRRRPGDRVELIDGAGGRWDAEVLEPGERARVRVVGDRRESAPPPPVVLHVAALEAGRLDLVVEKSAEFGLAELVVMVTERAGRALDQGAWERRAARLGRVAEGAARQSGQARLPLLRGLVAFPQVLSEIPAGEGYLIDPRGDAPLSTALEARGEPPAPRRLLVGPEAGFSESEVSAARDAGLAICALGGAVLRAETAALVALALALDASGALGRA